MRTRISALGICLSILASLSMAAIGDSICSIQSKPGTCVEAKDKDTVFVPADMMLFGKEVSFCPDTVPGTRGKVQIIMVLDKSGSMDGTDPNRRLPTRADSVVEQVRRMSPDSKIGIILMPGRAGGTTPQGLPPVSLNNAANVGLLHTWINYARTHGGYTPYGASLDTALTYFGRLPATDTNRVLIFLSDGEPCLGGTPCTDPRYDLFVSAGRRALLPPTYTIYYYATSPSATAAGVLQSLAANADAGRGAYYPAPNADALDAVFDDILRTIQPTRTVENFFMLNTMTGQTVMANTSDTAKKVMVPFEQIYLQPGANTVQFYYKTKGDTSAPTENDIFKTVTLFRRPGSTTSGQNAEFDSTFMDVCFEKSSITFTNASYVSMPAGAVYDPNFLNVYVGGRRGPGTSTTAADTATVVITSRSGDAERITITETGLSTNAYRGLVRLTNSSSRVQYDNNLQVLAIDTLYLRYLNPEYYSNGQYYDMSLDTIVVRYIGKVKSIVLYEEPGNPASLVPLANPTTPIEVVVTEPQTLWAKGFDGNGYWLGNPTTGLDTIKVRWTTTGFKGTILLIGTADSAYKLFAPQLAYDTGYVIASKDTGGGVIRDSIRVITRPGPPVRLSIEDQPNGLSVASIDTLVVPAGKLSDTVYAVGRDTFDNFTGNIASTWSKSLANTIFSASPGPDTKSTVTRTPANATGIGFLRALAASLPAETIQVKLVDYYYTALQINEVPGGNITDKAINTGQSVSLVAYGLRSTDGNWEPVNVTWSLTNLVDQNGAAPTGTPTYTFEPKSPGSGPGNTGTITATLTQYGAGSTLTDVVNMTVTPQPPTRYTTVLSPTRLAAGGTINVALTAWNDDGVYPVNLDMSMCWYSDQVKLPSNTIPQTIAGNNMGNAAAPACFLVHFTNGVSSLNTVLTIVTPVYGSRLHFYDTRGITTVDSTGTFIVTPGALAALQIVNSQGAEMLAQTTNNKNGRIELYLQGYDGYGNLISNTIGTWSTTSPLTDNQFVRTLPNPGPEAIYTPVEDPGDHCGLIRVDNGAIWDTISVCVVDSLLARMEPVITRDTDGDGYLDRLDVHLNEPVKILSSANVEAAFVVSGQVAGRTVTWRVIGITGVNSTTGDYQLTLEEHADSLETGATLNVPLFINEDDTVRVNTETGEYTERVEKG